MKHYHAQSCHEIGYKWYITAPEGLSRDDIDSLQTALANYSDEPSVGDLAELLVDPSLYLADYFDDLDEAKLALLHHVSFTIKTVHRSTSTQFVSEVAKSEA
jgi:hypothetical protein